MRSLISLSAGIFLALAVGSGSVLAAKPNHEVIGGTDVVDDFCGTGQSVMVSSKGVLNSWEDAAAGHISNTWTNPLNGATVIDSFSGGGRVSFIDDGAGAYTVVTERVGVPEKLRAPGGPPLTMDRGYIAFYDHFDADDNYLGTDVVMHGPHPEVDSGFSLYCQVMIEALGL